MAYRVANTGGRGEGFRPWESRLLGNYERAKFCVPSGHAALPAGAAVTGGLGDFSLSDIPSWAWVAAGVGIYLFAFGTRRRRRSRAAA